MSAGLRGAGGRDGARPPQEHQAGEAHAPANIPFVMLGTGMLWFGWFGFNAGSALVGGRPGGDGVRDDEHRLGRGGARLDLLRRLARAQAVGDGRVRRRGGRPGRDHAGRRLRHASATASSSASRRASTSNLMVHWKSKSTLDDTLDVFPCHGVGGMVGMLLTGVFAKDVGLISGPRADVPRPLRRAGVRRGVRLLRLVGALQGDGPHHPAARLRRAGRDRPRSRQHGEMMRNRPCRARWRRRPDRRTVAQDFRPAWGSGRQSLNLRGRGVWRRSLDLQTIRPGALSASSRTPSASRRACRAAATPESDDGCR